MKKSIVKYYNALNEVAMLLYKNAQRKYLTFIIYFFILLSSIIFSKSVRISFILNLVFKILSLINIIIASD